MSEDRTDLCVVGAGIIGLATAWAATKRRPGARVVVLEKEDSLAFHQTGRNSGVIHSGIYYKPGSLKAETCRSGREALFAFCQEHGVSYELCGKVVVALNESELPALEKIRDRALANGAEVEELLRWVRQEETMLRQQCGLQDHTPQYRHHRDPR